MFLARYVARLVALFRKTLEPLCVLILGAYCFSNCSAPQYDGSKLGKQAAIDAANESLSHGDCASALAALLPIYNSASSDNDIRMAIASAYGCSAHINFFDVLNKMTTLNISTGLWSSMAQLFPSVAPSGVLQPGDSVVESAAYGIDALQSVLNPGVVISLADYINYPGYNPGSILNRDHTVDSNDYLAIMSMAAVGGIESRYGLPDSSFLKTQKMFLRPSGAEVAATGILPNSDACLYSSSVLNLLDGMASISANSPPGGLVSNLNSALSAYSNIINQACESGCRGTNTLGLWVISSGCALPAGTCNVCPATLRNKANCLGTNTDINSCAAVGIINFVNASPAQNPLGWPN